MTMASESFSLAEVLAVARIHPFYVSNIEYPPSKEALQLVLGLVENDTTVDVLRSWPLLRKKNLYDAIKRLVDDTSRQNTYRHNVYVSITGGGFGTKPLFFATDVYENRRHRAHFGRFIRDTGLIEHGDWALTTHCAGELYRSLDLMLEILENAGASVLSAGNHMTPAEVTQLLTAYHINVLTGDSSQIAQLVHYMSKLPQSDRGRIKLDKIIYTSEVLTVAQRAHIKATLGDVKIFSVLGSAEAGPWAVSNPNLTGNQATTNHQDFIFDSRAMLIEILPATTSEDDEAVAPVPDGEQGIIVQTSLARLRNPLVRYITGDIGSLEPLPKHAGTMVPASDLPFLRVLRLHGRDRRFSFDWDGEYIEFSDLASLINKEECGVLQWQVILDKMEPSLESSLQFRLLCSSRSDSTVSTEAVAQRIRSFVHVYPANMHRFSIVFVDALDGFERSTTGRKVIKFIDHYN